MPVRADAVPGTASRKGHHDLPIDNDGAYNTPSSPPTPKTRREEQPHAGPDRCRQQQIHDAHDGRYTDAHGVSSLMYTGIVRPARLIVQGAMDRIA